jgi:hypothetical protein
MNLLLLAQSLLLALAAVIVLASCWINFRNTTLIARE